jgi:capsule biosynthesis phosphatase
MIRREKVIVMDIDGTICPIKQAHENYADLEPHADIVARLREYRSQGFYVILQSSRNMNTYDGNTGLITAKTGKVLLAWLDRHQIPYDELHLGKPWAGAGGFYVDDKAIRPDEFASLSYEEVLKLVAPNEIGIVGVR